MNKKNRLIRIIFSTLGVLAILSFTISCKCNKKKATSADAATTTATAPIASAVIAGKLDANTGNFIYETGELFQIKLPNGIDIAEIGKNSTEAKLFNFLNDTGLTVNEDKTQGWITLDRVYFDTGKSTLTAESNKQVKNIAEILKAFPNAKAKIGGYTDNTGTVEANKAVSTDRAKAVAAELTKLGIVADRISPEGYGSEHSICEANDTPECMAQNRRVDIRIVEK